MQICIHFSNIFLFAVNGKKNLNWKRPYKPMVQLKPVYLHCPYYLMIYWNGDLALQIKPKSHEMLAWRKFDPSHVERQSTNFYKTALNYRPKKQ